MPIAVTHVQGAELAHLSKLMTQSTAEPVATVGFVPNTRTANTYS